MRGPLPPFSVVNGSETFAFIGGGKSETPGVYALNGEHHTEDFNRCDRRAIAGPDHGGARCGVWLVPRTIRHFFIGWTLPTTAIVFDTTTGIWAERASRYIDENDDTIDITYRATRFVQAYGNLYGDSQDG